MYDYITEYPNFKSLKVTRSTHMKPVTIFGILWNILYKRDRNHRLPN